MREALLRIRIPSIMIIMYVCSNRTRRLLKRSKPEVHGTAKVLSMLQNVPAVKEETKLETSEGDGTRETIVLDTIAEFCRQVGEKEEGESDHTTLYIDAKHHCA